MEFEGRLDIIEMIMGHFVSKGDPDHCHRDIFDIS